MKQKEPPKTTKSSAKLSLRFKFLKCLHCPGLKAEFLKFSRTQIMSPVMQGVCPLPCLFAVDNRR